VTVRDELPDRCAEAEEARPPAKDEDLWQLVLLHAPPILQRDVKRFGDRGTERAGELRPEIGSGGEDRVQRLAEVERAGRRKGGGLGEDVEEVRVLVQ